MPAAARSATVLGMNTSTAIQTSPIAAALRAGGFVGRLVEPGDDGYDEARAGFNGAIDRRPAAVARACDAEDVAAAVRAARSAGLDFTIRAGGHSVSGRSMRDGALCIDVRDLNAVDVDPASALVRVGGGALLSEVDAATQEHGLAVPAGQISHTGVGGLTLGGGIGWLMRNHGLTIDSLVGAEVVLADGRLVHASADENRDLFWALRGGGGDFGAVTSFEFRARRVGPMVLGGMLVYPWEQVREVLRATRELMPDAPEELTDLRRGAHGAPRGAVPGRAQGGPSRSSGWRGAVTWTRASACSRRCGRSARRPPIWWLRCPTSRSSRCSTRPLRAGWHYYDRMHYLADVSDGFIDALVAGFEAVPTPQAHIVTGWMGGAIDRVAPGETAFGHRGVRAFTWVIGCSGEEPVGPVRDWVRRVWDDTAPFAGGGVYVNALDGERSVRDAYADDIWNRLVAVKRRYDPDGAFNGNGIR